MAVGGAAITGFIAKENVVGTLAVVYGLTNFIDTEELALVGGGNEVAAVMGLTKAAALAYLMFNLFTPPCFAALGAMNSEMQDKKWLWGGIALQLGTGYTIAFFVYQIGTLITTGSLGTGFLPGLAAVLVMAGVLVSIIKKNTERIWCKIQLARIDTDNGEEYVYGKFIGSRNFAFSSGSCCGLYYKSKKSGTKCIGCPWGSLF